jgi:hypothetical protein
MGVPMVLWALPVRRQCLLLFATGFIARLALIFATHEFRDVTRFEVQRTAYSVATTGVFGNPYAIETGPTAHVSPGYPLVLAGIYRVFGGGTRGELVKEVLASAVSSLDWALMPMMASVLGFPPLVGLVSGLLGALLPLKLSVETKGDWEAPYSALAVMLTTCLTARLWRSRTYGIGEAFRSGAVWGVCSLFFAALLPGLLVFGAVGFYRGGSRKYAGFLAVQLAIAALVLSPWMIRNQLELGAPVLTRSNLGLELRLSNNDFAGPLERDNYLKGVYHRYHPLQSVAQAESVQALGELAYNRLAANEALNWIRSHPSRFLVLTAQRVFYFWFQPIPGQTAKAIWLDLTALLGLAGLMLLWRSHFWTAAPLALFLLILPLPSYFVHVGVRQRFPVDWIYLLLAVYAVDWFLRPGAPVQPRTRLILETRITMKDKSEAKTELPV